MFAGVEVVFDRYCFHQLISTALAKEATLVWQSACARRVLRNGTGLWLLHLIGPMALAWPGHTGSPGSCLLAGYCFRKIVLNVVVFLT